MEDLAHSPSASTAYGTSQSAPRGYWGEGIAVATIAVVLHFTLLGRHSTNADEPRAVGTQTLNATQDQQAEARVAADPSSRPATGAKTLSEARPTSLTLAELVQRVQAEEAKFSIVDVRIRQSSRHDLNSSMLPGSAPNSSKPKETVVRDEGFRAIKAGDRLFFTGEDTVRVGANAPLRMTRKTVCDGSMTVSIEDGDSVCIHETRYEPSQYLPPHAYGVFAAGINFPLSVFLEGTAALDGHPKVRRLTVLGGYGFQFGRVDVEIAGEQSIGDLDCVVVTARRWIQENSDPVIEQLWLAKDRNYHVARFRSYYLGQEGKRVGEWGLAVTDWLEAGPNLWIPKAVERLEVPSADANETRCSLQFVVEKFAINPMIQETIFTLPTIPPDLPVFTMSSDGRLIDSPHHPKPAEATPGVTLNTILTQLDAEEQKYGSLETITLTSYQMLNVKEAAGRGSILSYRKRERSVVQGDMTYYEEHVDSRTFEGTKRGRSQRMASDGNRSRTLSWIGSEARDQTYAQLALDASAAQSVLWPHTLLMRSDGHHWRSLAERFRIGWYDPHNKYPMKVEYVGDERVDGLHCYKLRCQLHDIVANPLASYFFLWLARDRNLIPIRREFFEPSWNRGLASSIEYVDELREIRPGVWFPWHKVTLPFRKGYSEGLSENRPILQWRHETTVESAQADPQPPSSLFYNLEAPAGTQIQLTEDGQYLGQFKLAEAGNIDIAPQPLLELRQKAQVAKDEQDRRDNALKALIGQPAPELPATTWLNGPPLTWKDLKGKVVLLDFWATWCGPCAGDLARLADVHKRWQDIGLENRVIIGIHTAGSERAEVEKVVVEKSLGYPITIDSPSETGRSWGRVFGQYAVHQIPLVFVVDGEGKIAAYGQLEEMLSKASELAREPEATQK